MREHRISIVIPVYLGETTLPTVVAELRDLVRDLQTPEGNRYRVHEVVLVCDRGPDRSGDVCRALAASYPWVRVTWLSRNFGQHAATLAGIAASGGDWIVTMDEDGQHDPTAIGAMLDLALRERRQVVYARPSNPPPHGPLRNASSSAAKWISSKLLTSGGIGRFHSYRLVLGEVGRGMAAFCGPGVYLDVALSWVSMTPGYLPVAMRSEGGRRSGYSWRRLASHFWQLVISSGTRPLRLVSIAGAMLSLSGFGLAVVAITRRLLDEVKVAGWTSVFVAVLLVGGFVMLSLGVIAEYIGVAVKMAMGKPLYLVVGDPEDGPLGTSGDEEGTTVP